jgi:hypothetical protein
MISGLIKRSFKSAVIAGAFVLCGNAYGQLGLNWTEMGPNDLGGRTRSVIVDKTDATGKTLFAAGVSGGVFKSMNTGQTWLPVNDQAPSLIISSMAQANDGTIYVGTGESFSRGGNGAGQSGFIGTGLYKFSPGSNVFTLVTDSATFGNINEIAIAPGSSSIIYVAADRGFFVSTDGGGSFTENAITTTTVASHASAMDVKVAIDGGVYVAVGNKAANNSKVYYSATGGNSTYTDITPVLPTNYTAGRIEIATSPTDANYVYISIAKQFTTTTGGTLSGIFISDNKGTNWTVITYGTTQFDPLSSGTKGYGDYSHSLAVDPSNPKSVFLGGQQLQKWSQNSSLPLGQGDWTQIGLEFPLSVAFYIHPKIHDLKFDAGQGTLIIATDGGIYRSVTGGLTINGSTGWLPFNNGFNITQFNSVAFAPMATASSTSAASFSGLGGGSVGNDFVYMPGDLNTVQNSVSFGSSDAYQSDFSKILPRAVFYSGPFGSLYRTASIETTDPGPFTDAHYDIAATGGPGATTFGSENTPARLWENYGGGTTDSAIFYNPQVSQKFVNSNATQKTFTISNQRPQRSARYQKITIVSQSTVTANQTITIVPQYESARKIGGYTISGSTSTVNMVTIGDSSLIDQIVFTFNTAPNTSTVTAYLDLYYVPGPDFINNTVKTSTATTTKFATTIKRPTWNGKYKTITAVDPTNSQTITLVPVYSGTAITSLTPSGPTGTNNAVVLHSKKIYSLVDTIRFEFATAPTGTNTNISVTTEFDPMDSILVKYNDISGLPYTTGIPITTVFTNTTSSSVSPLPMMKIALPFSARYAVGTGGLNPSIYVVKRPLNFGTNPQFVKIAGKFSRIDSVSNVPSKKTQAVSGTPTKIEWAPDGLNLYFSTKLNDTSYFFYRISHLEFIGDSAAADYSGLFTSDVDSTSTKGRLSTKIRTTMMGRFKYPITSIAVKPDNSGVLITCGGYGNKTATLYESNGDIRTATTNSVNTANFTAKNGTGLPLIPAYSSLYEVKDSKRVLIGTEAGLYTTTDITQASPTWFKENNNQLPNVPIFQIRQQTLPNWLSKNSGLIYVATHGRGIWTTDAFYTAYAIGIEEQESMPTIGNNMILFPNPASNEVNLWFSAKGDASYSVNVYDVNGKAVISDDFGKLPEGEHKLPLNTTSLTTGIYFINISGSNNFSATSKLVIAK